MPTYPTPQTPMTTPRVIIAWPGFKVDHNPNTHNHARKRYYHNGLYKRRSHHGRGQHYCFRAILQTLQTAAVGAMSFICSANRDEYPYQPHTRSHARYKHQRNLSTAWHADSLHWPPHNPRFVTPAYGREASARAGGNELVWLITWAWTWHQLYLSPPLYSCSRGDVSSCFDPWTSSTWPVLVWERVKSNAANINEGYRLKADLWW